MNDKRSVLIVSAILASIGLAACGGSSGGDRVTASTSSRGHELPRVAFIGDSVAAQEELPVAAALHASRVGFVPLAEVGGGNVVGPFSAHYWKRLPGLIARARAGVVVYQVTSYDWGSETAQIGAYRRLLRTVATSGATLDIVTMPPIVADDFYRPHMAQLATTTSAADAVAAGSSGRASVLDAGAVWGARYRRARAGIPDRSSDGIHVCPQGAARFTAWLLDRLAASHRGFAPAPPSAWANAGWSASREFHGC